MTFANRLYAAFGACVAFTLAISGLALYETWKLSGHTREIATVRLPAVESLLEAKAAMREFRTQELQHLLSDGAAERADWEAKMAVTLNEPNLARMLEAVLPEGAWGGIAATLDALSDQVSQEALDAREARSAAEDLDMVQAISDFQSRQSGYDAALKTYSIVQRMSLFDYLR